MAREYDEEQLGAILDERNRQLDEEVGESRQYFDDNGETIPQEVIDEQTRYLLGGEADAQLGKKANTPDQSVQSQQTTQHPIVQQPVKQQSSGYSTPTRYFPKSSAKSAEAAERERLRAEERKRERAAQAAGREAAARTRQQLLDSGMYFDDGKGNIKLKQAYRRSHERLPDGRYIKTGNNTDTRAGMTRSMIEEAGRTAYQTTWNQLLENQNAARLGASAEKTQSIVNQNKLELQEAAQRKAEASTNAAKGNLAIYDGLVAAYKDLTDESNRGRIEEEVRKVWGGKDEQGRDARWMYDDKGRVIGQAAEREVKTGRRFRNGYVARGVIATINDALQERGNNTFRITGIIARQGVDAIGNASGEPTFYVQGIKTDGSNGPGVPFGKRMTLRGLYRMGVENGIAAGNEGAEENVIHDLGDVMGVAESRAKKSVNSEKIILERMKNAANGAKFDKDRYAALQSRLDSLKYDLEYGPDGSVLNRTPRELNEEESALAKRIMSSMDTLLGIDATAQEPTERQTDGFDDATRLAAYQELERRRAARQQQAQSATEPPPAQTQTGAETTSEQAAENNAESSAKDSKGVKKVTSADIRKERRTKDLNEFLDNAYANAKAAVERDIREGKITEADAERETKANFDAWMRAEAAKRGLEAGEVVSYEDYLKHLEERNRPKPAPTVGKGVSKDQRFSNQVM